MEYMDDRKFIEVYVCVPKIVVIDEVLTKLLQQVKRCSFFAPHGSYIH